MANVKIPAPPFQGVMFFRDVPDGEGWSETYYLSGPSYASCLVQLQGLRTLRSFTMTPELEIFLIRVSDTTKRSDTLVDSTVQSGQYPIGGGGSGRSLPSTDCWLDRWDLSPLGSKHIVRLMHGVPRTLVDTNQDRLFVPDTQWITAYNSWATGIKAAAQGVVKTANGPPPVWTAFTIAQTKYETQLLSRKVGRPFGQRRGRRAIV